MVRIIERVRAVVFDLDGTLVDSAPDLATAANRMLQTLGYAPLSENVIRMQIGDGLDRLIEGVVTESAGDVSCATLEVAAKLFRKLYSQGVFERSRVYPGVRECLEALNAMGKPVGCATNKHSRFALPLLEASGLMSLLAFVFCADRDEQRKPNPYLLDAACARVGISPRELLYVGDSGLDIMAARAAGCAVVAVDYGYSRGVAPDADGPDWIVSSLTEILALSADRRLVKLSAA